MNVTFLNPGADTMISQILEFQTEGETAFWSDPLFYFYPQLDRAHADNLPFAKKREYIEHTLRAVYPEIEETINKKVCMYSQYWDVCKPQISAALSDAFGIDCSGLFNDLRCHVTMDPIEPRFLRDRRFDVFYLNSEKGAIGESIHEIIHFMWFYVWNQLFCDDYDEYERPSLKWILSEMVVESVMRDERLSSINPYFPRKNGGCVYPCFFDMKVDGALILDTLDTMYNSQSIEDFMRGSFAYCKEHETEIREHMKSKGAI